MAPKPTTTAGKVKRAIADGGLKKVWLAGKLGITRPTLDERLKNNSFTKEEKQTLYDLKIIEP